MKIIATVSSGRFLVEATEDELAKVMGFSGSYSLKDSNKIVVGREVEVSPLWQALSVTRSRQRDVADLAASLRNVADRVDKVNATLAAPIVEVKEP